MKALLRSWPRLLAACGLVAGLLAMHALSTQHPVDTQEATVAAVSGTHAANDTGSGDRFPAAPSALHIASFCAAIVAVLSAAYRLRHRSGTLLRATRASLPSPLLPRSLVARAPSPRLLCVQRC